MLSVGKLKKNKLGVSVIIGYILLVAFAVVTGAIVYNYLRTYVPTQQLSCPDGVSLFVQDSNYCGNQLNLTIRNNGRFDVAGYYIRATNSSSQTIPIIDLSSSLNSTFGGVLNGNLIMFSQANNNSFSTGNQTTHVYGVSPFLGTIASIQIVPAFYEVQNNRNVLARCSNSIITESDLQCKPVCVPKTCDNIVSGGAVCGSFSDGCGGTLNCAPGCSGTNVCSNGQCVPPAQCTDTCTSLGYQCGTWPICGTNTQCGNNGQCVTGTGPYCSSAGQCVSSACGTSSQTCSSGSSQSCTTLGGYSGTQSCNSQCTGFNTCTTTQYCGDGIVNGNEQCDVGSQNGVSGSGCSSTCTLTGGGVSSCATYCVSQRYSNGQCANTGQCGNLGGVLKSGGDSWCSTSNSKTCCCFN